MPAPEVGKPLPRGDEAFVDDAKWYGYVLAEDGHGPEWRKVFRFEPEQAHELWQAVADIAAIAPVTTIRPTRRGVGCSISAELTFNARTTIVRLAWFYDHPDDPPRLITAFPTP